MFILAVLTSRLLKLVGMESIPVSFIRLFNSTEFMASEGFIGLVLKL